METTTDAQKMGYDAGLNGANTVNSNYQYFHMPHSAKEWQEGYAAGKEAAEKNKTE